MDDIKEQILQTSARLFLKYGLRSVTIDDVCNELRISKKTFYNYFRQKEELIDSIIQLHCDSHKGAKSEKQPYWHDSSLNAIDKLVKGAAFWTNEENQEPVTFFYDLMKYYPEIHNRMFARMDEDAIQLFKQWLQGGIDEGLVRTDTDIDLLAIYLNNHFRKGLPELLNKLPEISTVKTVEFLLDCCIRIIVSEKGYHYYQEKYMGKLALTMKSRKKKKQ